MKKINDNESGYDRRDWQEWRRASMFPWIPGGMMAAFVSWILLGWILESGWSKASGGARYDTKGESLPPGAVVRMGDLGLKHEALITRIAVSPDGKTLASASLDKTVRFWDSVTGKEVGRIPCIALTFALSADWSVCVTSDGGFGIKVWHVSDHRLLREVTTTPAAHDPPALGLSSVDCSPDGRWIVAVQTDRLQWWDCENGRMVVDFKTDESWPVPVAFAPRGNMLASGHAGYIWLWNTATRTRERKIAVTTELTTKKRTNRAGKPFDVEQILFSPDGRILAAQVAQSAILLWEAATGKYLGYLPKDDFGICSFALSPDGKRIAIGRSDSTVLIWEVSTGRAIQKLSLSYADPIYNIVTSLAFMSDGKRLASVCNETWICMWDLATGKPIPRPPTHELPVTSVAFSADGKLLATASKDRTVRIWEAHNGHQRMRLSLPASDYTCLFGTPVRFSPDSKRVGAAALDGSVRIWDLDSGQSSVCLARDLDASSVVLSNDLQLAAVERTSKDQVDLWHIPNRHKLGALLNEESGAPPIQMSECSQRLAFSADKKLFAFVNDAGVIQVHQIPSGKCISRLIGHTNEVHAVAFSPDNKLLASGAGGSDEHGGPFDNTLRLWDVATGKRWFKKEWQDEDEAVYAVAFSPDGRILASGGHGGTIRLWEVFTGQEILRFREGENKVYALAFSPDGKTLASGMGNGTALIWRLAPPDLSPRPEKPGEQELVHLWRDLAAPDAALAYRSVCRLCSMPGEAIPLLAKELGAIPDKTPETISQWIRDLNSSDSGIRQRATVELSRAGASAEPALRVALASNPSVEVRRRLEPLMQSFAGPFLKDPGELRILRAIWVLEKIATPEARALLEKLAHSEAGARHSEAAKAAVKRLEG